ncbi:major facilitator superfamily domain-containing protein 6 [Caerostris extrusa]|uniref:Major facilitator superfamily domain-containing protein 6 n=1 Tax=Caerostris extrusa TaxID=172846 RepID=A0AAV4TBD2_CAEEX|nr:major facilitator superfamily domain-containing protein 6 [Caerostris extrusa]
MCKIFRNSTGHCYLVSCEFLTNLTETQNINDFYTYQFWLFALFTSAGMTCTSALFTLSDTACCESIQKTGAEFGRQRLWGAISWGVICPIGGLLNDYTDDYLASWILMAIMSALTLWNISKLDLLKPQFSQNILKDFGRVFKSKEFLIFEFAVLLNGIATGFVWFYLMLFLITIGGSRFLLGIAQTVQCFGGEIPCMFFSGWLINKLGHFNVLTLSLLCYCIRFVWYSFLQDPWLVLPVECLHGITYGMLYTAVASYAKLNAKPGTEATTQSVLFTTHEGLGAGLGCVLAGIGFDLLGGHETFFRASLFSGCGAVVSIFLHLCARRAGGSITVTPPSDP